MNNSALTLYELNNIVRSTINTTLSDEFWIKTELSEVRESRGHCYLEFVQKDDKTNHLVAKARGQIWAGKWSFLRPYFEQTTNQQLSSGMQVLVQVQVTFHELFGYSLNVTDIDPTFTLGDIARHRQEIIKQLEDEGVLTMNKDIPLPRLIKRIAVISSATAAGYGDFSNQLNNNAHHFAFNIQLFPAIMQGTNVESSIISALNRIAEESTNWDVVVIIRGGGAASDLSGFDTLSLAENVAQFPLPIITGIGHERDDTVIDLVSHTRVKTPTAAAEFIIHHQEQQLELLDDLTRRLSNATINTIQEQKTKISLSATKIPVLFSDIKTKENIHINKLITSLNYSAARLFDKEHVKIESLVDKFRTQIPIIINSAKQKLTICENKILYSDPTHILKLGYSITTCCGNIITDSSQLKHGDKIETRFAEGEIESIVTMPH